jgi:uncharacterized protein (UPF0332 family)
LVKTGRVSITLGKSLNKAEELRLIADYKGDPIDLNAATWVVSEAHTFVQAMQDTFMS